MVANYEFHLKPLTVAYIFQSFIKIIFNYIEFAIKFE